MPDTGSHEDLVSDKTISCSDPGQDTQARAQVEMYSSEEVLAMLVHQLDMLILLVRTMYLSEQVLVAITLLADDR